ncbi:hypothetical protein V1512DRAFT_278555 [Lipomyces arxii]|uniref:uncharacterized protein n=1 Tax=Lipomyces arxii TaxID=56418 RepID=UPI0034CF95A9
MSGSNSGPVDAFATANFIPLDSSGSASNKNKQKNKPKKLKGKKKSKSAGNTPVKGQSPTRSSAEGLKRRKSNGNGNGNGKDKQAANNSASKKNKKKQKKNNNNNNTKNVEKDRHSAIQTLQTKVLSKLASMARLNNKDKEIVNNKENKSGPAENQFDVLQNLPSSGHYAQAPESSGPASTPDSEYEPELPEDAGSSYVTLEDSDGGYDLAEHFEETNHIERQAQTVNQMQVENHGNDTLRIQSPISIASSESIQLYDEETDKESFTNLSKPIDSKAETAVKDDDGFIAFELSDNENSITETENTGDSGQDNGTRPEKRKRGILSKIAGALKIEPRGQKRRREEEEDLQTTAPWTIGRDYSREGEVSMWLHKELLDFVESVSPTDVQIELRASTVDRIQKCVKSLWSDATLCVFGSYATNLYLPDSDIDLVIISEDQRYDTRSSLYQLANALKSAQIAVTVEVIASARVPIIKFKDRKSGISVDISFERYGGVVAADTIMHWVVERPGLRELVIIIKYFLAKRELNSVPDGGLGGFAVVCLVLSFLQMHPKVASGDILPEENLGVLLIQFFELYGKNFNYDNVGIFVKGNGSYFDKNLDHQLQIRGGKYSLVIRDPNDETNNISRSTYNLRNIRRAFAGAYDILTTQCYEMDALSRRQWVNKSLLASILYIRDDRNVALRYE